MLTYERSLFRIQRRVITQLLFRFRNFPSDPAARYFSIVMPIARVAGDVTRGLDLITELLLSLGFISTFADARLGRIERRR